MSDSIEPFHLAIPQSALDDLHARLDRTRWPEKEVVADWSQGVPMAAIRDLCDYWRSGYDWRRCEAMLNDFGQYRTAIHGLDIHFLHIPSPEPAALPIILTHGWPGSVIEFHQVIAPLTDPVAHGGNAKDAFHVVVPSLPGYGFSGKPTSSGWNVERIASAWAELMRRLGYAHYVAQGGDWGAAITTFMGARRLAGCAAIHLNLAVVVPTAQEVEAASPAERRWIERMASYYDFEAGYSTLQRTKPQTLGYALADSPVGQAAWIYEKFHGWADHQGAPENIFSRDAMLDNIMLYWLPNTAASSARLYWESLTVTTSLPTVEIPSAISIFPQEIVGTSRRWADRKFTNIIHWNELDHGGHFAAFEQPALFIDELRAAFRSVR